MLTAARGIAARVELAIRLATVDAYLMELPVEGAVVCEVLSEGYGVGLAVPVRGLASAEHLSCTVIDVLPVQEHDDTGGHWRPPVWK
jgi:hypothetical protein